VSYFGSAGAGFPTKVDHRQPIELQRQVQVAAGSLTLIATLLGLTVSEWFLAIPLFVGGGLTLAGVTGFCGMARVLQRGFPGIRHRNRPYEWN
jgi:hypothetical protein